MGGILAQNAKHPGWGRMARSAGAYGRLPDQNAVSINECYLIIDIDDDQNWPGR